MNGFLKPIRVERDRYLGDGVVFMWQFADLLLQYTRAFKMNIAAILHDGCQGSKGFRT